MTIILLAGFPIVMLVLLVDFISTGQFPILIQERYLTERKRKIKILKIRTIKDSTYLLSTRNSGEILRNEEYLDYVPPFCKWLRKSGVDEILQVLNVFKGELSLVGPRPLLLRDLDAIKKDYPELFEKREKINSLPGITGYWQIYGDREKGAKNLLELDEYYDNNKSFLLDIKIILKTFYVLLTATHSDAIIKSKDKTKIFKIIPAD